MSNDYKRATLLYGIAEPSFTYNVK